MEVAVGGGVNRMGIGSMVRAYRVGHQEVLLAHLGLGSETACDVIVTLPHGAGTIVRENVKADQRLTVTLTPPR